MDFVSRLFPEDILEFLDLIRYRDNSTKIKFSKCPSYDSFTSYTCVAEFNSFGKTYFLEYTDTTAKLTSEKSFVVPGKKAIQPIGERTIAIKWVNFLKQKFGDEYIEFFNKNFFVSADGRVVEIDSIPYIKALTFDDIKEIFVATRKTDNIDWIDKVEEVDSDDCRKCHVIIHYKAEYNMPDTDFIFSNFLVIEPVVASSTGLFLKAMAKIFGERYLQDFRTYRRNMFYAKTIKALFEQYNEKTESAISKIEKSLTDSTN